MHILCRFRGLAHPIPGAPTSFRLIFGLHIHAWMLGVTGRVAQGPEQRHVQTAGLRALEGQKTYIDPTGRTRLSIFDGCPMMGRATMLPSHA